MVRGEAIDFGAGVWRSAVRWLAWATGGTASARRQMLRARLFLTGLALIVAAGSWRPAPALAQLPAGEETEVGGRPLLGRGWGVGSGVPGALPAAGTATLGYADLAPRALVAAPGVGWATPSQCPDPAAAASSAGPFWQETAGRGMAADVSEFPVASTFDPRKTPAVWYFLAKVSRLVVSEMCVDGLQRMLITSGH